MIRLAVRDQATFAVEPLEIRRRGPSYTVDTVRALAARWPNAKLHLIMGADMYRTFEQWRDPEAISEHAVIAVLLRPGARLPRASRAPARGQGVLRLTNPGLSLSSSALRERARRGLSLRGFVPDAVVRYIERHGLYGERSRRSQGERSLRTPGTRSRRTSGTGLRRSQGTRSRRPPGTGSRRAPAGGRA